MGTLLSHPLSACAASLERLVGVDATDRAEVSDVGEVPELAADRPVIATLALVNVLVPDVVVVDTAL